MYCQLSVHGMSVITTTYFVAKLVNVILLIEADWPFQHMSLEIYVILTQCVQCPSLSVFFFVYKTGTITTLVTIRQIFCSRGRPVEQFYRTSSRNFYCISG